MSLKVFGKLIEYIVVKGRVIEVVCLKNSVELF